MEAVRFSGGRKCPLALASVDRADEDTFGPCEFTNSCRSLCRGDRVIATDETLVDVELISDSRIVGNSIVPRIAVDVDEMSFDTNGVIQEIVAAQLVELPVIRDVACQHKNGRVRESVTCVT